MLRITYKSTQSLNRLSQNHIKDQLRSLIFQAPLIIGKYLILGLVHCRQAVDSSRYVIKGAKSKSKVDIKSALFTQVERVVKHLQYLQLGNVRKQSRETVSGVIFVCKGIADKCEIFSVWIISVTNICTLDRKDPSVGTQL